MRFIFEFNFRGFSEKISKSGKKFYILNLESIDTGEHFRFFVNDFSKFNVLEKGKDYSFIFTVSSFSNRLYLEGVEM